MKKDPETIYKIIKEYPITVEIIIGFAAIGFLVYKLNYLLMSGETTLYHDNISWNYPIFQFFAENIIHNNFPFWNPFTHSGEPFYPILGQLRFFEPITLLTIYFGQFFSDDIVLLFNWNFIMKSLFMGFGVYIVFRTLARNLFIRLTLIPILLYSSFMVVSSRQCGLFDQFLLIPFVIFFLLRIVYHKDYRWHNWLMLGATIGLNWQSYFFTGTWIFLLFFFAGFVLFRRDLLIALFMSKMVFVKSVVLSAIILAMMAPSIALVLEKDKFAFPARMLDTSLVDGLPRGGPQQYEGGSIDSDASTSINMPYRLIAHTGTFSTIWDFIQLISPEGNRHFGWSGRIAWGNPSEAYMYIGIFPWFIALLGMVAGRDTMKKVWMLTLIAFGLLMLGPAGGLHRVLYYVYPPMWFVRHTHSFVLLFLFALLYFYILGLNHLFETMSSSIFPQEKKEGILNRFIKNKRFRRLCAIILFSELVILSLYWTACLKYPQSNYMFGIIILMGVIGWFLRNDLGKKGLYLCFVICHVVIILLFSENHYKFFRYILPVTVVPITLFTIIKTKKNLSDSAKSCLTMVLVTVFAVCLTGDLLYHFKKASKICSRTAHPGPALNIDTHPQEPILPVERSIYPKYSNNNYNGQATRYMSLIYRKPYVFSPIMEEDKSLRKYYTPIQETSDTFKTVDCEKWFVLPDGTLSLKDLTYHQDGSGGTVERYIDDEGNGGQDIYALLKASSHGRSLLHYETNQIEELKGHYIKISIMVKSDNRVPNAIQVSMRDREGTIIENFYENSGTWEMLELIKYFDEDSEFLQVDCVVKSEATAGVFLKEVKMDIMPLDLNFYDQFVVPNDSVFEEYNKFDFNRWFILPDGRFAPEKFEYHQDGSGGSVERIVNSEGIENGNVFALLHPSSHGRSFLTYISDQIDELRGNYVRVIVKVKSQNSTFDAVQVDLQDGTESVELRTYENSGDWEYLELLKFIDEKTKYLQITCNINSEATAGVYIDEVLIDVVAKIGIRPYRKENYALEFEGALKSKRWNSFFVPRKYLELVHAEIPFPALVEMFAVNKPVFQFKQNIVHVDESKISHFLSNLGAKKSVKLLSDCVLVDSELEPSLLQLKMSPEEYVAAGSPGADGNSNTLENISGAKKAGAFSYSIGKYNYDSFDLQVSADQKGVLYWADGYDEGWHAYLNGKEVPIYRANINFKAIALPEGENKVRFFYNPFLFKITLLIFYGVFVASLIAAVATGITHTKIYQ